MTVIADPEHLAHALGVPGDIDGQVAWAVENVSAVIRYYIGWQVTSASAIYEVAGTPERRLVPGPRPLTAVRSVALDGVTLDPGEYRWQRRGVLWRDAGWLDESRTVTIDCDAGFDRVPRDLAAVCETAAARLYRNPLRWRTITDIEPGEHGATLTRVATDEALGFTIAERCVLDRYRRRTWP